VIVLRVALILLGLVVLVAGLLVGEPEVFRWTFLAGVGLFVVGAGEAAADAVPLRRAALAAAAATMVVGLMVGLRILPPVPAGIVVLVLQGVALREPRPIRRLPSA
jgi:hypothetical protein